MAGTANSIITPQMPKSAHVATTTANSTYSTTPTNSVLLATAGANGSRLTRLHAIPTATVTTANQLQVFRSLDAGTTKYFADSQAMATYSLTQSTQAPKTDFGYSDDNPMILAPGEQLWVATGESQAVAWVAEWGDF
ncbi:MAG TPA: hypothetical protein VHW05_07625 [Phenylobacterium sp.]|jgi:hypothetical protein|nr:hypothetical protein [Phenylobacterium sp.]